MVGAAYLWSGLCFAGSSLRENWELDANFVGSRRRLVKTFNLRRTIDGMKKSVSTRAIRIIAAAALSISVLSAGATYAFTHDSRGGRHVASPGTIYSDVGTSYGSYDFSGSREEELPVWDGKLS